MNTITCSNNLCGKEYNVRFDKCPFCGTSNPLDEHERNAKIENDGDVIGTESDGEEKLNGWVTGIIWLNILFGGIKGVINSVTVMIYSPIWGVIDLFLQIVGVVSLCFLLSAKKWAFYLWFGYLVTVSMINGYLDNNDYLTYAIVAAIKLVIMVSFLQIKKNGVSAWSIIFKRQGSTATGDSVIPTSKEDVLGENTLQPTNLVDDKKKETQNTCDKTDAIQCHDGTDRTEEPYELISTEVKQANLLPATRTERQTQTWNDGVRYESATNQNLNEVEPKQGHGRNDNPNKRIYWGIIGLIIAAVSLGIWALTKPSTENSSTEQTDSSSTELFDCGLFSLEYPKTFETTPIQNSPHMVFKAISDNYYLTASYWDYGFDDNVNIWDDQVYEQYKQMPVPDGYIVEVTRETIRIKDDQVRCLKIKANERPQWYDGDVGMVYYLLIRNGYLFTFAVGSNVDTYYVGSATPYPDQIMEGLRFKSSSKKEASVSFDNNNSRTKKVDNGDNSANDLSQKIHDELEKSARDYNRELPENIGYGMTMTRCVLEGNSMVYTIKWVGLSPSDFSTEDIKELKEDLIEGLREEMNNTISRYMLNRMSEYGYDFIYRLINEKGERLCSIRISPNEL